jgi:hypothetical protein
VVDLVNDVLRKRKYFNPQGWETFGEALREANVPQDDWSQGPLEIHHSYKMLSPPNRPATDDLFHTRPLDVWEIFV